MTFNEARDFITRLISEAGPLVVEPTSEDYG